MENKYLLLWLEGNFQAWGTDSKFGVRECGRFPSKSAIIGLLFSALGLSGSQEAKLAEYAAFKLDVISYRKFSSFFLKDFHMVGSGYNRSDPWEKNNILAKDDGKPPSTGGSKLTYRYYLQDYAFAAILELPENIDDALDEALMNPTYDLYLGRKTCVPSEYIYQGFYKSKKAALEKCKDIAKAKDLKENFKVEETSIDTKDFMQSLKNDIFINEIKSLNDVPLAFGQRKKYKSRFVTISLSDGKEK